MPVVTEKKDVPVQVAVEQITELDQLSNEIKKRSSILLKDSLLLSSLFHLQNDTLFWHPNNKDQFSLSLETFTRLTPQDRINWLVNHFDVIPTASIPQFPSQIDSNSLSGIRVALDPGHSSGTFKTAKLEGKYVELLKKENPELTTDIQLVESILNYQTAKLLKGKLEAKGAIVLMTRENKGHSAMGYSFTTWLDEHFALHLDSLYSNLQLTEKEYSYYKKIKKKNSEYSKKRLFKLYNKIDFHKRSEKIIAFKPHITLIMHYNVDIHNQPWTSPSNRNYAMSFVPGSFMTSEIASHADQFHFLRLLFTNSLESSILFSHSITSKITELENIQYVSKADSIPYLEKFAVPTQYKGVYARNLALTRILPGIICYSEPLCQDNLHEAISLNEKDPTNENFTGNKRVEAIANAYYQGIIHFLTENKPKK